MAAMTLAEIDAEIAELRQAEKDCLVGKRRTEVRYGDTGVRFGGDHAATLTAIRQRLTELQLLHSQLAGEPSGLGPFRPGLGARV